MKLKIDGEELSFNWRDGQQPPALPLRMHGQIWRPGVASPTTYAIDANREVWIDGWLSSASKLFRTVDCEIHKNRLREALGMERQTTAREASLALVEAALTFAAQSEKLARALRSFAETLGEDYFGYESREDLYDACLGVPKE